MGGRLWFPALRYANPARGEVAAALPRIRDVA